MTRHISIVFVLLVASAFTVPATEIAISNVTIVNVATGKLERNMSVVIAGNRIMRVGRRTKPARGATVVDGNGKFLIPGLWDMHVHIFNNVGSPGTDNKDSYFPLFIANGITGVRDTFTDPDDIKALRAWSAEIEQGRMIGPRVVPGSSIIDGVPVLQAHSVGVTNEREARDAVRVSAASGSAFIKVYENLSRESYFAIAEESKKRGLPFIGHVPYTLTPQEASDAGQKSIEHLTRMTIACSSDEDKFRNIRNQEWTAELRRELYDSFSEKKCRSVAEVFVKNHTWHDPTLVEAVGRLLGDDPKLAEDDRTRFVSTGDLDGWLAFAKRFSPANRKMREANFERWLEILKIMHRAGVPIIAGTDVGNPFIYAGSSLHDELSLFVRAGMTPLEALQTATINPARFLGMERRLGSVEKGKLADLVMLDADPLADISNSRKINAVITNGRLVRREELDAMLQKVERTFFAK